MKKENEIRNVFLNEIERNKELLKQLSNIMTNDKMKKMIISKDDFKNYFNEKKSMELKEYEEYLNRNKCLENFPTFSRLSSK